MIGSFSGIEAGLSVIGHLSILQAAVFFVGMGIRFSFYLIETLWIRTAQA
jgi:hypothetical protein